ncbi:hypothetical protein [Rhizomonospora bruguierae]|uniref:hypothetical protein n=1 Tax=Rhizomonospora bruguierae TaxID=1581705 RepID=UPI001BCA6878|nr:hypothetical protein [Micromonospora sp. NBRC 107566]
MKSAAERHVELVERLPVHATSARGYVEVDRAENGDISVKLRNQALRRLNHEELAAEISGGLEAALREYSRKSHETRRRLVGADFERDILGVAE